MFQTQTLLTFTIRVITLPTPKQKLLFIGKLKSCTEQLGNINWQQKPVKAQGVYFGTNKIECYNLNWNTKLENCENVVKNWTKRNLTFLGKIKIIKTLLLPKFVYLAQSSIIPQDIVKKIDSLIFNFLWHGKREKIKRTTLIGQTQHGGIEMCDTISFFKSLKLKW